MEKQNKRVEVTKEIAEAIEDARLFYDDREIIETVVGDRGNTVYGSKIAFLVNAYKEDRDFLGVLMHALVDGYVIEKTEQEKKYEKVKILYDAQLTSWGASFGDYEDGYADAIDRVTRVLGIHKEVFGGGSE